MRSLQATNHMFIPWSLGQHFRMYSRTESVTFETPDRSNQTKDDREANREQIAPGSASDISTSFRAW